MIVATGYVGTAALVHTDSSVRRTKGRRSNQREAPFARSTHRSTAIPLLQRNLASPSFSFLCDSLRLRVSQCSVFELMHEKEERPAPNASSPIKSTYPYEPKPLQFSHLRAAFVASIPASGPFASGYGIFVGGGVPYA